MNYIKGYDTLRAFSIILVVVSHLLPAGYAFYDTRMWIVVSGTTGVQIFFTLSGFLITTILLKERGKKGKINFKNFFARRFIRLLPPLILFYAIIAVFMLRGDISSTLIGYVFSVFYVYNFVHHDYYTVELGHTWSLAVEEQFYLTWPFILSLFKRVNQLYFIVGGILIMCLIGYYLFPTLAVADHYHTDRWFFPAVAPIIVGSLFAILNNRYSEKWKIHFHSKYWYLIAGIGLFLYPLYSLELLLVTAPIFQAVGVSLGLIWLLYNQSSKITAILDNLLFRYIGKISYGIYVYQGFFLRTGPGGELAVQQYPLNILLVLLMAVLSYELYEKPILQLKKKFV
ncbi:MAG: acyltransferase [Flavobacteriales bacterium]|jgi:peptidoglycan/LPS O-acetylase OafA/YrhL|nr:acyltransferase [Flavobacteriales bacterium]